MKTFPVFWVLDNLPSLISGLSSFVDNPLIVLRRAQVEAVWPPASPVWTTGADPFVDHAAETLYAGPLDSYPGTVTTSPGLNDIANLHLDLNTSAFLTHPDMRFKFLGGFPSTTIQPWGFEGTISAPDDWFTDDLATNVFVHVYPPLAGWCMRGYVFHPARAKRIATYAPGRGPSSYDLGANAVAYVVPNTSGLLTYEVEVNGAVTTRTTAYTAPTGDEFGGRLYELTPAHGYDAPGWSGYIFDQAGTSTSHNFTPAIEVDLPGDGVNLVRWRAYDHEGRSTPWLHYLVPPVSGIAELDDDEQAVEEDITFTAAPIDPDGSIARYDWYFGDGATLSIEGPGGASVTHAYATENTWPVTLQIFDNDGLTHDVTISVVVTTPAEQIGAVVRPDKSLIVAAAATGHAVEVVRYFPKSGPSREVLATIANADTPSLSSAGGGMELMYRDRGSGHFVQKGSTDGGRVWQ